ncbi:MAG: hypothetical protein RR626_07385 [Anaerovoracaceae bacterium]
MRTLFKVMSILYIIGGGLGVLLGILATVGVGLLGAAGAGATGTDAETLGVFAILGAAVGVVYVIGGGLGILIGIFGLKGLGGKKGLLTASLVLVIIGAVISVIGLFTGGDFSISSIAVLIAPALFLVGGFNVKKELQ